MPSLALQAAPGDHGRPDAARSRLATPSPLPPAAASPTAASAAAVLRPKGVRRHRPAGDFLPYPCSEVSSVASGWRAEVQLQAGGSLLAKGLTTNDISRAHENTPGVCVLRHLDLPNVPPAAGQEFRVREVTKQLNKVRAEDARARAAFRAQMAQPAGNQGLSSEVLPVQQRRTVGKPALCKPMESPAELGELLHSQDSYFTSEYRANNWWKTVFPSQRKELKEHVRPYDNWTLFRDNSAKQVAAMREPIHTY